MAIAHSTATQILVMREMATRKLQLVEEQFRNQLIDKDTYKHAVAQLHAEVQEAMYYDYAEDKMKITIGGNGGAGGGGGSAMSQGGAGVAGLGAINVPQQAKKPDWWAKLCSRMDWDLTGAANRHNLALFEDGDFIFAMGVMNGEPFTLKDEKHMWPSDQVVAQLRVLYAE